MDRHRVRVIVAGLLLAACVVGTHVWAKPLVSLRPKPKSLQWQTDLVAAHKIAVRDGKPLLVVFGAPWCGYCRKLETETLGDATMVKFVESEFVPVHLDYDKDRRIVEVLAVKSLPTSVVLSTDADILATLVGYYDKTDFRRRLDNAIAAGK